MSVPAQLSNPGLALQGACFDLDDMQALVDDYEGRVAAERAQRERAEQHLAACIARIQGLEVELAKVKNVVVGALATMQGPLAAPSPGPTAGPSYSPRAAAPHAAHAEDKPKRRVMRSRR
jgi:hypothetical protein